MKTMLASIALVLGASAALAAEPVVMNECLRIQAVSQASADAGAHDVQAGVQWACDPALVGAGVVKFRVNGEPVAGPMAWDGSAPLVLKTTVTTSVVPLKVCAAVAGFDASGEPTVFAEQCTIAVMMSTTPTVPSDVTTTRPGRRNGHPRR